ncbi:NB-ARC domain-containing protein [Kutzneria buriramensis]|uniref:Helix-turn-helix protein n=1 Tax=Kutzneria buriramensis TaxID=1045776 RepID=A0A3E0HE35_9PSEU|nr:helix-turn-helix domain-containing protein [Kutzneria buriramensis]REH42902.1 helix-turn-helix protein [Kutzneria buriramensis]
MTDPRWDDSTPRWYPTAAEQFGERLAVLRNHAGLSLRALAGRTGIPKSVLGRLERGTTGPGVDAARTLDDALRAGGSLLVLGLAARAEPYPHLPPAPFFLGRRRELTRLTALARGESPNVIFIAGPPGVGKTALALRWANGVQDLFDVVLWSHLRGHTAGEPATIADVLEDLLRGLGNESDGIPCGEPERASALRDQLGRRAQRVLVVLDNAADSHQVLPILPALPGCTVLVTSRIQLSALVIEAGAGAVPLDMMDSADAAHLVGVLIGEDRADAERDAVAQLVDLCGALPLAVVVAAERIAAAPDRTVASHVVEMADLGRRLRLLDLDDEDDSIGVRAAFTWSYQALPAPAARMFRLLSLHPGTTISVSSAATLAGIPATEAASLLDVLAVAHLLQRTPGEYYGFHDLLRGYAIDVAAGEPAEDRAAAVRRLVDWYLHAANAASRALTPARDHHIELPGGPGPAFGGFDEAYAWCSREVSNFVPVARLAFDHALHFEAWRIMVELHDFFALAHPWHVWIDGYEIAVRAAQAVADESRLAEARVKLADGFRRRGDVARALELETLVVDTVDGRSRGWALLGLATDEPRDRWARLIRDAVDTFAAAGSWFGEATARVALGLACTGDEALEHGRWALDTFLAHDDRHGAAHARWALARSCRLAGDLEAALAYCEQSIADHPDADARGRAEALHEQGLVQLGLGRHDEAIRSLGRAIGLVEGYDERTADRLRAGLAALAQG